VTPPEAFATADASSTVYYDWGETTASVPAQAGLPV
jgi:hypothetical protein